MVFPILGANSATADGFSIENSLRFNNDDSPYLTFTPSSAGDRDVFTWSAWIKINGISGTYPIFTAGAGNGGGWSSGGTGTGIILYNDQFLTYWNSPSSPTYSSNLIRDPTAWYHVVLQANDTTLKVFVNGVERSSKSISGDAEINNTNAQTIGRYSNNTDAYFDGYMTEINFVDGTAKAPTDFGEYNDDNVWIPKEYDGSYGSNGFRLEFKQTGTSANASGIGADTSGNGNHFAVNNIAGTDVTTDTCVNNFCTLNPLVASSNVPTLSQGNLLTTPTGNGWSNTGGTILIQDSGKWYAETVLTYVNNQSGTFGITEPTTANQNAYNNANQYAIVWQDANVPRYVATVSASGTEANKVNNEDPAVGDIFQVAYDADNGKIWFGKNNTWRTGNPSTDTSPTYSSITGDKVFHATNYRVSSGSTYTAQLVNFGQEGSFAGNKTAQGNSDANGYGDFYYSPPSGYYALNTKNLAEFG